MSAISLFKKLTMPWFSAMRFYKWASVKKYLTPAEKRCYVPRSEELRIASMIKNERENFFIITGPKKSGKSYLLMHMADTSLRKDALYLKLERKVDSVNELYQLIAKTLGYHHIYEESVLGALLAPWKMFQSVKVGHFELAEYAKKVGKVCKKLNKGKLPVLMIDEVSPLATSEGKALDFLAYMAKSLAVSHSMIFVFGLLDAFGPNIFNKNEYSMNKREVYLNYMPAEAIKEYVDKAVSKYHPLRERVIEVVNEESRKIYGGNFQYIDLLINLLENAKTEEDIQKARADTEDRVIFDIGDELKKTFFKEQTIPESSVKMSLIKAFDAITKKGKISLDTYLSFFSKADQPLASKFLYDYMILKEQRDQVAFRGRAVKYFIEKNILSKYASSISKEDEMKLERDIQEFKTFIEDNAILQVEGLKWSNVIGMDDVKQKVMETIIFPTLNPTLFTGLRTPARGVLFYGPGGNGKTFIAKVIASECKDSITFLKVSPSTFDAYPYNQDPDKMIKALFAVASAKHPAIIFIDEMDLIMSKRGPEDTERSRRLKNEFLIQFQGMLTGEANRVVVIGATNKLEDIDDAILRRFPVRIDMNGPTAEARKQMIKSMVAKVKSEMSEEDYDKIVGLTDKYSFADLEDLCREASYEAIRELPVPKLKKLQSKDIRPVRLEDFEKTFARLTNTLAERTKLKKSGMEEGN